MGEVEYAPGEAKGTPWHPHRGFETVTYMLDGVFEHADSNGGGGVITNGDTQWMTAGAGILHIEKPPEWLVAQGGLFHGFQLWVNLPRGPEARRSALPGHPRQRGRPAGLARRRHAGPGDRRRGGGTRRAGLHLHADDPRAPDARAGRHRPAPVACRLQRARLRPGGSGHGGRRGPAGAAGPARGLRTGQHADVRGGPGPGEPGAEPRRPRPRRPTDPRAGRLGWARSS